MPFLLIATRTGELVRSIDLSHRRKLTIGRSERCDITIGARSVSRHHALLFRHGERWLLADTDSTTGVFTGSDEAEVRLTLSELTADAWLRIGPAYLWLDDEEDSSRPSTGRSAILRSRSGDTLAPIDDPALDLISSFGSGKAAEDEYRGGARLRIRDEKCHPRLELDLSGRECVTIGRGKVCDITIDAESVSLLHAVLYLAGKRWCLFDLDSANGTFIEGKRIGRQALSDHMIIALGPTLMTLSGSHVGQGERKQAAAEADPSPGGDLSAIFDEGA
jgi:pSer/pThr/pTyr-binding forkhead associated (FHA) protein